MHGRLKVKTTAEQQEAKRKEREKKLKLFQAGIQNTFKKREKGEYDEEALTITSQFLQANPDFYTLWNFRREIILNMMTIKNEEEFQLLTEEELILTKNCLMKNPKSYGAWYHRRWIMKKIPNPCWNKELCLCDRFLETDERNFHGWAYRRFVVYNAQIPAQDELDFTLKKIEANFSNYSAWHYRSALLPIVYPGSSGNVEENALLKEYDLVQNAAFTDPNDQSVWFYHRWLLGRGGKPLHIVLLYVTRCNPKIIIQFSKPVVADIVNNCLDVRINDNIVQTDWKQPLKTESASCIWSSSVSTDILHPDQEHFVLASFQLATQCDILSCIITGQEGYSLQYPDRRELFRSELSASATSVLEQELDICKQLHDLEPENKWTIFNCILLMRALNNEGFEDETLKYIDWILKVDPLRSNYYNDLRSKFVIENSIEKISDNQRDFSLTGQHLTTLHHMDHLVLMTTVNFSNNCLQSLHFVRYLLCVQNLTVDSNCLTDCYGVGELAYLETLSLKNNKIKTLEDLDELASCPKLSYLYLEGNPVAKDNTLDKLKLLITTLKALDEIIL